MKKIRWVLAHEPIDLFLRAAKRFTAEVNEKLGGVFEIEVMTLSQYADRYNNGVAVTKHDLLDLMEEGKIEMSQMYTTWLGERYNKDLHVLDLPFLFKDHTHAAKVLEGEIGQQLLDCIGDKKPVKGLAFTYSGGFRMIPATKEIHSMEDFKGLNIRSNRSPVAVDTITATGANPVVMELEDISGAVNDGTVVGGESTYPRFYGLKQNEVCPVINHTEHSLFLTSILVSTDFWATLSPELKAVISDASVNAARSERAESIEDIGLVQARCAKEGIKVVTMPKAEMARFETMMEPVYAKYQNYFTPGLLTGIQAAHAA